MIEGQIILTSSLSAPLQQIESDAKQFFTDQKIDYRGPIRVHTDPKEDKTFRRIWFCTGLEGLQLAGRHFQSLESKLITVEISCFTHDPQGEKLDVWQDEQITKASLAKGIPLFPTPQISLKVDQKAKKIEVHADLHGRKSIKQIEKKTGKRTLEIILPPQKTAMKCSACGETFKQTSACDEAFKLKRSECHSVCPKCGKVLNETELPLSAVAKQPKLSPRLARPGVGKPVLHS